MGLDVSEPLSMAIFTEVLPLPPPINPNTKIKISGNAMLNTTAEGLRKIAFKLPFVMANMALI
jgi:hypothetical protein